MIVVPDWEMTFETGQYRGNPVMNYVGACHQPGQHEFGGCEPFVRSAPFERFVRNVDQISCLQECTAMALGDAMDLLTDD